MTLEDAVEHYQSQVPARRTKFKRTLAALRERFTQEERLFTPAYVTAIFDAAEDEIRKRNQLAGSSLRRAIDSGLPLREDQAQSALVACFSRLDYRRDSFSDIPDAIIDATDNLGRHDTELENRFSRHVSEIFAQAGQEQIAELKMYLKQREEKAEASKKERIKLTSTAPSLSTEAMKIDDQQLAILEYLEREGDEMMPPARMISEKTGIDFGATCDELTLLESGGLVFCVRLPGHPMRDGRFRLDDGGHALLAEKRKAARSVTTEVAVTQASMQTSSSTIDSRKVFVVHGRDHSFASAMSDFIRSLDLVPMEWSEAVALTGKGAPYLNEVLRAALNVAQSIVILLTPDNEARLRPALSAKDESDDEKEFRFHPRQNVVYEAGLAFGMAPDRTIIVKAGPVLIASDMQGLNYVAFDGDPGSRNRLAERLRVCGCKVQRSGEDWLRSGVFPTYADLLDKSPEAPAPKTKEASDHAFEVLPRLHLRLGSGMGGPDGHYITGFLKNVGRGVAYNPTLFLPGIGDVLLDTVIKKDEPLEQKIRYDDKDVFTSFLSDKTVRVGFEDELGNHYEQEGQVQQALTPGGTIVSYGVNGLDKPELVAEGS